MTKFGELHKSAALLIIPVLLTRWFISDGGLHNGLNRLVFELIVAHSLLATVCYGLGSR